MERRIEGAPAPDPVVSALFGTVVVLAAVGVVLAIPAWPHLEPSDAVPLPLLPVAAIVYATLGALILRRARNPFGWILLLVAAATALMFVTSCYAVVGLEGATSLPAAEVVGVISEALFVPVVMAIGFMLLLFPTGALPSPRWRPVAVIAVAATAITIAAFMLTPREVALPAPGGVSVTYPNPLGLSSLRNSFLGTLGGLGVVSLALLAAGAAALVVRYRSGDVELRQQIKWVGLAAGTFLAVQLILTAVLGASDTSTTVGIAIGLASATLALIGLPVAITVAILRYGLYQIDLIINRAVVYTLLAAGVTVVYVAIVVGIGALLGSHGGPLLTIVAAAAIALLFQPLRQRAQAVANRIVYGERASPYQVLSEFADSMANTLPLEEQLDRMVALLASGTGATRAEVWIRVGPELRAVAAWPGSATVPPPLVGDGDDASAFDGATAVFPVQQGDERLGAIAVHKPPNEPLAPAEAALAEHVASQAGLVVRNVRLTAELRRTIDELRASRRRLIDAQDLERRKIERNLHDGAQQQLVALGVQLGLLERLARAVPDADRVTGAIPRLQEMLGGALEDLRDLARGIYPPLLADRGLAVALDAQARKAVVPTTVDADGIGRFDRQVEAAVYFCTLEALQNVAKYAAATATMVRLRGDDGWLSFEVRDDGRGFEPDHASGSGIQGMADRLDAIGGSLEVDSTPGAGTVVRGRIPAAPLADQE
ncbi:MAG TPA: histidine kinase [Actinomycetota bacterium]|nr:histidine kinase [Actinomycetota bacterium]